MNTPNVGAGRLERRVRLAGRETRPGFSAVTLCLYLRRIVACAPNPPYGLLVITGNRANSWSSPQYTPYYPKK